MAQRSTVREAAGTAFAPEQKQSLSDRLARRILAFLLDFTWRLDDATPIAISSFLRHCDEEIDLCFRARKAGWTVVFWPGAEFVHVGGASTAAVWPSMYREQLRSHLRFLAKHHGLQEAERARKLLAAAMRIRALVFGILRRTERRALSLDAVAWLRSGDTSALLELSPPPKTL